MEKAMKWKTYFTDNSFQHLLELSIEKVLKTEKQTLKNLPFMVQ